MRKYLSGSLNAVAFIVASLDLSHVLEEVRFTTGVIVVSLPIIVCVISLFNRVLARAVYGKGGIIFFMYVLVIRFIIGTLWIGVLISLVSIIIMTPVLAYGRSIGVRKDIIG